VGLLEICLLRAVNVREQCSMATLLESLAFRRLCFAVAFLVSLWRFTGFAAPDIISPVYLDFVSRTHKTFVWGLAILSITSYNSKLLLSPTFSRVIVRKA